jgi:hypothetical protein
MTLASRQVLTCTVPGNDRYMVVPVPVVSKYRPYEMFEFEFVLRTSAVLSPPGAGGTCSAPLATVRLG